MYKLLIDIYYKTPVKQSGFLHLLGKDNKVFTLIHLDHPRSFITTECENKYILASLCGYSK